MGASEAMQFVEKPCPGPCNVHLTLEPAEKQPASGDRIAQGRLMMICEYEQFPGYKYFQLFLSSGWG